MVLILIFALAGVWLLPGGVGADLPLGPPPAAAPSQALSFPFFAAPAQMHLCGEPVPLNEPEVREDLDREFVIEVWSRAQTTMWLKRAHRYFPEIERKLRTRRLPLDLKYVTLVESDLRPLAQSRVGALGPWQFMAPTAQQLQLRADKTVDERLSFEASTDAALTHLEHLYRLFRNWALALAAYNAGEGRVQKAIAAQGVNNFYHLSLPEETERYIFRILAAKIIMEDPGRHGFSIPEDQLYPPLSYDEVMLTVPQEIPVRKLAEASGTYYKTIKTLNPWIRGDTLTSGTFRLKIPKGSTPRFQATMRQEPPPASTPGTGPAAPGAGTTKK
jgi:membrane-bound lytic murein transglycosylase D